MQLFATVVLENALCATMESRPRKPKAKGKRKAGAKSSGKRGKTGSDGTDASLRTRTRVPAKRLRKAATVPEVAMRRRDSSDEDADVGTPPRSVPHPDGPETTLPRAADRTGDEAPAEVPLRMRTNYQTFRMEQEAERASAAALQRRGRPGSSYEHPLVIPDDPADVAVPSDDDDGYATPGSVTGPPRAMMSNPFTWAGTGRRLGNRVPRWASQAERLEEQHPELLRAPRRRGSTGRPAGSVVQQDPLGRPMPFDDSPMDPGVAEFFARARAAMRIAQGYGMVITIESLSSAGFANLLGTMSEDVEVDLSHCGPLKLDLHKVRGSTAISWGQPSCAVCVEDFKQDETLWTTTCMTKAPDTVHKGHVFHKKCILRWAQVGKRVRKATCPLCKTCINAPDDSPPGTLEV